MLSEIVQSMAQIQAPRPVVEFDVSKMAVTSFVGLEGGGQGRVRIRCSQLIVVLVALRILALVPTLPQDGEHLLGG